MPTKFYHVERANRKIRSGGYEWIPDTYEQACGCWLGVLAEPDEARQAVLDELTKVRTNAITSITEEEYAKKKPQPRQLSTPSAPSRPLKAAIVGPGVVPVENTNSNPAPDKRAAVPLEELEAVYPVKAFNYDLG